MSIKKWLREDSIKIADEIAHINNTHLKDNISGFGMKGRVLEVLDILRAALFPTIYEQNIPDKELLATLVNERLNSAAIKLSAVIREVLTNQCEREQRDNCTGCTDRAEQATIAFMAKLPEIRRTLCTDIEAAFDGDPAARYTEEIILSYPAIEAITTYRIAHELLLLNVPFLPRIMTECAHQRTGIDIHPGATIGKRFFIDHGTGVVIGETCTIGDNVKLYQGVTLGAKSFELDENGNPVKGVKRHPDIEDDVIIYAGATILGGDTVIGKGSIIGGNVWLINSVPAYSMVYNSTPAPNVRQKKA